MRRAGRVLGLVVLWVVAVPMLFVVIPLLVYDQESDEVDANETTRGVVLAHLDPPESSTTLCRFAYRVDGARYVDVDDCSPPSEHPVGSTVTVSYGADEPGVGFLNGDKTWWDKLRTVAITGGVLAAIAAVAAWFVRRDVRRQRRSDS